MAQIDCVIPAHEKDLETLGHTLASIRAHCPEVRRIIVISRAQLHGHDEGVEWVDEAAACWPFQLADLDRCGCPPGWLFQQLLKLYAPLVLPGLLTHVLICDSDVIWMPGESRFLVANEGSLQVQLCTFEAETCPPIRSSLDLNRYDDFLEALLPGLRKTRPGEESAVCHHALLQRDILGALHVQVEKVNSKPFWLAFRDAAQRCQGKASEYELYAAFARREFPAMISLRALAFAVVADFEAAMASPPPGIAFIVAHSHLRGLSKEELLDREGTINGNTEAELLRFVGHGHSDELAAILVQSRML